MNTAEIEVAMRSRFCAPEYALIFNVRNATGYSYGPERYADAIAISCYPSRGLNLIGFEFKASRSDWLNELKNPDKAEPIVQFCDQWYLVAGDKEIVKPGELPPTWGLIIPHGQLLKISIEAPKLDSKPISRRFLAAIMRAAANQSPGEATIKQAVDKAIKENNEYYEKQRKREYENGRRDYLNLQSRLDEFEKRSGIKINEYSGKNIGDIVRIIKDIGIVGQYNNLITLRNNLVQLKDAIDKGVEQMSAIINEQER